MEEQFQSPAEATKLGPFGRLISVIFSPGEAFADINRKPTWLAPIVIGILVSVGTTQLFNWRVKPDWEQIIRRAIQQRVQRSGGQMPPDEAIKRQASISRAVGQAISILWMPAFCLIVAGIFAVALMLMQAQTTFKKVLSVVSWSSCATGLIGGIVFAAALMARDPQSIRSMDPSKFNQIAATNLAAFLPADASPFLASIAGSIDIFTIWFLVLVSMGLVAIAGSRSMKMGKAASMVFGLWAIWVLIKAGATAAFGF
jgi:hypothetical protein